MIERYSHTVEDPAALLRWAAERIPGQRGWAADSQAMGIIETETGAIKAVGVINMIADGDAWVHFATAGAMPRPVAALMAPLLAYAFHALKLDRLTARIEAENIAAQIFALRLGFRIEGRAAAAFRGHDVAILALLRRDWIAPEAEEDDDGRRR